MRLVVESVLGSLTKYNAPSVPTHVLSVQTELEGEWNEGSVLAATRSFTLPGPPSRLVSLFAQQIRLYSDVTPWLEVMPDNSITGFDHITLIGYLVKK